MTERAAFKARDAIERTLALEKDEIFDLSKGHLKELRI